MQGMSASIDTQGEWIYAFEYIEFIREFTRVEKHMQMSSIGTKLVL